MKVYGDLFQAQLHSNAGALSGTITGRIYYNTTSKKAVLDDGTIHRAFLVNDQYCVFGNNGTASSNIRLNRAAAGVLQMVTGDDVTAEGSLSTALAQLSFKVEGYATGSLPAAGRAGRLLYDTTVNFMKLDNGSTILQLATLTGVETYANKTLTTPAINGANFNYGTASDTNRLLLPTETSVNLDALTDTAGLFAYDSSQAKPVYNDGSGWKVIGSGSGGAINYITDSDAEVSVGSWITYADAAAATIADATGGSPTITWTRSTSSPGRGNASFLFTKDAANRQGQGASFLIAINPADQGKVLQLSMDLAIASGTFADGDLYLWIYDVTNTQVIQPAGFKIYNATTGLWTKQLATFQTASNSTSYRVAIHCASTSASAYTVKFDNIFCGPQILSQGSVVTDWLAFTPTGGWVANSTYTGFWRRVGDCMEVQAQIALGGAPTSANCTINLPSGYTIDTTKLLSNIVSTNNSVPSDGTYYDATGSSYPLLARYSSTTAVVLTLADDAANGTIYNTLTQAVPVTVATGDNVTISFKVPILGWSSGALMSQDAGDSRVVEANYTNCATSVTDSGVAAVFTTKNTDTHAAYNTSTGVYTCPVPGRYKVYGTLVTGSVLWVAGNRIRVDLRKNGSVVQLAAFERIEVALTTQHGITYVGETNCNAGDTLDILVTSTQTNSLNTTDCSFIVERLSGPNAIAASESVSCRYHTVTNQTLTDGNRPDFNVKVWDSHGAVSGSGNTWAFTAPISGVYSVNCRMRSSTDSVNVADNFILNMYANGSLFERDVASSSSTTGMGYSPQINTSCRLLAGQTIYFTMGVDASLSGTMNTNSYDNSVTITRTGNY